MAYQQIEKVPTCSHRNDNLFRVMTSETRQMKGFEVRTVAKCESFEYKMYSSELRLPHHV